MSAAARAVPGGSSGRPAGQLGWRGGARSAARQRRTTVCRSRWRTAPGRRSGRPARPGRHRSGTRPGRAAAGPGGRLPRVTHSTRCPRSVPRSATSAPMTSPRRAPVNSRTATSAAVRARCGPGSVSAAWTSARAWPGVRRGAGGVRGAAARGRARPAAGLAGMCPRRASQVYQLDTAAERAGRAGRGQPGGFQLPGVPGYVQHGDAGDRMHFLFPAPGEPGRRAAGPPRRADADIPGVGGAGALRPLGGKPAEHQQGHRVGASLRGHERGSGRVAAAHGRTLARESSSIRIIIQDSLLSGMRAASQMSDSPCGTMPQNVRIFRGRAE